MADKEPIMNWAINNALYDLIIMGYIRKITANEMLMINILLCPTLSIMIPLGNMNAVYPSQYDVTKSPSIAVLTFIIISRKGNNEGTANLIITITKNRKKATISLLTINKN